MTCMGNIGEVTLIYTGNGWDIEWQMDYLSLSNETDAYYRSKYFFFEDTHGYLVIWPNGRELWKTTGFIGVHLDTVSSNNPSINVEFCFALKSVNGQKDLERHATEVFKGSFGLLRLVSKSDFEKRKSEFLASGKLTVVCRLKKITSTESVECSYCKKTFDAEILPSHERKCSVKCPECSDIVLHQYWNYHECDSSRTEGESSTSVSSIIPPKSKTLLDLKQLYLNQENCDVVLSVKGREFSAHKAILTARSPVFASTFRNDMKEKETGIVEIEDCDPSSFSDFLCFLYCEEMEIICAGNVFSLFIAADKYDVTDLRTKCLEFMKENISADIFCETITIALQHTETEVLHSSTDFFLENAEEVVETAKWQSFVDENPTESNELFIKYIKSVKNSKK